MDWTRKDWQDVGLMSIGSVLGVGLFMGVLVPFFGIEFSIWKGMAVGMLSGYLLRCALYLWKRA